MTTTSYTPDYFVICCNKIFRRFIIFFALNLRDWYISGKNTRKYNKPYAACFNPLEVFMHFNPTCASCHAVRMTPCFPVHRHETETTTAQYSPIILQHIFYNYVNSLINNPYPWVHNGTLARYVTLRVAHAPGMPGTFCPPPTSKETSS